MVVLDRRTSTHSRSSKSRNKTKTLGGNKNDKISLEVKFILLALFMTGLFLGIPYNVDNKVLNQIDMTSSSREKLMRDFLRSNHAKALNVADTTDTTLSKNDPNTQAGLMAAPVGEDFSETMGKYEQLKKDFRDSMGKQEEDDLSMTIITKSDDGIFCACDIVSVDCLDSVNCLPERATSLTSVATGILIRSLIKKTATFDGSSSDPGRVPVGKGFQYKTITAWLSWANENKLPSEHDPSPSYAFFKDAKHKFCDDNNLVGFHCYFTAIKQQEEFDRLEEEALPHLSGLLKSNPEMEQHILQKMQDIQAAVSKNKGNKIHALDHLRMTAQILRLLYNRQEPLRDLSSKIRVFNGELQKQSVTPPLRVSIHIRRADSCGGNGELLQEGHPLDSSAQPTSLRKCYATSVYMNALQRLKDMITKSDPARQIEVFISSDDASSMIDEIRDHFPKLYNTMAWHIHDIDRDRFKYDGWIESDIHEKHHLLGEAAVADLWLLSNGQVFFGPLGIRFGKVAYLLATARHNHFIPFFSVDGHSVCCEIDEPCGEMKPYITSMSDCLTFARDHDLVRKKGGELNKDYWEVGSLMRKIVAQGVDESRSEGHGGEGEGENADNADATDSANVKKNQSEQDTKRAR